MPSQLRLSEHYTSIQGEGARVGTLTQFVRFAGCNLRCPGWPCDTQHAIDPAIYREESVWKEPGDLADDILNNINWEGSKNVCLTGGEPFMQPNDLLQTMVTEVATMEPTSTFEVFTNGTFEFPAWAVRSNIMFMMDWKLKGSGEKFDIRKKDIRIKNAMTLRQTDGIKFVVKDQDDLMETMACMILLDTKRCMAQYWIGRCWDGELSDQDIIDYIKSTGCPARLNVQLHKYLWPADERKV